MDRYGMELEYLGLPATSIVTARGCPVACSFCSASKMHGRSYATRSPAKVVDEIEVLIESYGIEGIKIFDSTFTLNKKHVRGFCDELERRGLVMPWECEVRIGTVDKPLLEHMR
jgi:anaerobic magnesium-protoporphyrin IX monomethyl ester cyclase